MLTYGYNFKVFGRFDKEIKPSLSGFSVDYFVLNNKSEKKLIRKRFDQYTRTISSLFTHILRISFDLSYSIDLLGVHDLLFARCCTNL